jgi:hypothetical protein
MRLDLEVSLAPAPRTLLQTANVASCGQTAYANPSACGREPGLGGTSATTTTMTYPAATQRPSQPCPLKGLDGCYGELTKVNALIAFYLPNAPLRANAAKGVTGYDQATLIWSGPGRP